MTWNLTHAEGLLHEVLERVDTEGPQMITLHGRTYAVSAAPASSPATEPDAAFRDYLLHEGPRFDEAFELPPRQRAAGRPVDL